MLPTRPQRWYASLSIRILAVNILAIVMLAGGVLYLDSYRAKLIEQRRQQMLSQAQLMARAIGEVVHQSQTSLFPFGGSVSAQSAALLARLQVGERPPRVRLFDSASRLLADTHAPQSGPLVTIPLLHPGGIDWNGVRQRIAKGLDDMVEALGGRHGFPRYMDAPQTNNSHFPEIKAALTGKIVSSLRQRRDGVVVVIVAVPAEPTPGMSGALLMTGDTREIVSSVRRERFSSFQVFLLTLVLTLLLSFFLSRTIALPLRRLAAAAEQVRLGRGRDVAVPRFMGRHDEIGELARALADMTQTLHNRLDAIESFAADVAHELKNPLSSVRSAVDVLKSTQDPALVSRLLDIVHHDTTRLQRLITDISDASRLDAELSRAHMAPVDLGRMLATLIDIYRAATDRPDLRFIFVEPTEPVKISGLELRLGQVLRNLIDNAVSFSPAGGEVICTLGRLDDPIRGPVVQLTVEDTGPGIPEENRADIFRRFYSERPTSEGFGSHSGLGLSIARQIIEAHGGTIAADNRRDPMDSRHIRGARFTVDLPALIT